MASRASRFVQRVATSSSAAASSRSRSLPNLGFQTIRCKHNLSYEYPNRTESPKVSQTTAAEAATVTTEESWISKRRPASAMEEEDHFDDENTLPDLEKVARRESQKKFIETALQGGESRRICQDVPAYIPPNVSQEELVTPTTIISTLDNGIRVVSQETYGQVCTVGLLSNVGSRHERENQVGVTHLLEMLAFQSTDKYTSGLEIMESLQDWGGTSFANTGREQTLHCVDILRPNVEKAMDLLSEVVLRPKFMDYEVEDCKRAIEYQYMDLMVEMLLGETLQAAAYGEPHSQLGKPHFCPPEALPNLTADSVHEFWQTHMLQNPAGLVIAGAGIGHEELVDMSKHYFGELEAHTRQDPTVDSVYTGGASSVKKETMEGFTRVALAFELGGWHSDDLVPTCVLQTLLGGGNSFSAGGPGKGMYSRLYRQVLNKYYWAESAEAFTAFHGESGLFGLSASCIPSKSRDATLVLAEQLNKLKTELVTDEEIDRARNMLKCNVLTQLESRLVLFEDMGRQVLTYGHREDTETMCRKIDSVTKEDLRELAQRAMAKPPTIASVGDDVSIVPGYDEVVTCFK
eukprot:CAMPEP_0195295620 /NCGR_PEP_ID=MMETSP0707-20130614/17725_1 /TAXON_ID=33640 /ORGANISM="Asterionellopsis glacialis, Strain CCMP134" /LENGTH=575 /DNA_ID=CAMNT_0040356885 /DNA_START=66 /DNA_END=1793 /DNA_ORIENTATION=+